MLKCEWLTQWRKVWRTPAGWWISVITLCFSSFWDKEPSRSFTTCIKDAVPNPRPILQLAVSLTRHIPLLDAVSLMCPLRRIRSDCNPPWILGVPMWLHTSVRLSSVTSPRADKVQDWGDGSELKHEDLGLVPSNKTNKQTKSLGLMMSIIPALERQSIGSLCLSGQPP